METPLGILHQCMDDPLTANIPVKTWSHPSHHISTTRSWLPAHPWIRHSFLATMISTRGSGRLRSKNYSSKGISPRLLGCDANNSLQRQISTALPLPPSSIRQKHVFERMSRKQKDEVIMASGNELPPADEPTMRKEGGKDCEGAWIGGREPSPSRYVNLDGSGKEHD